MHSTLSLLFSNCTMLIHPWLVPCVCECTYICWISVPHVYNNTYVYTCTGSIVSAQMWMAFKTDSSELELLFYLLCRDHRKLFVGDSRGRVYTWVVSDTQGTCII